MRSRLKMEVARGMWVYIVVAVYSFAAGFFFSNLVLGQTLERSFNLTGGTPRVWGILWAFALSIIWPVGVPFTGVRSMKRLRRLRELEVNELLLSELEKKRREKTGG